MRISVNLATRPFVELRPFFARLRIIMALLVLVAGRQPGGENVAVEPCGDTAAGGNMEAHYVLLPCYDLAAQACRPPG